MQFSSILVAATAFALAKAAQITNTPGDFVGVSTGKAFDITWSNGTGPITLLLKNGVSTNLQTVATIASGLSGATGSYSWTPPSSLPSDTYAFEIDDSTGPNYSIQFALAGAASASSSASSTSTSSASSRSSSSSASITSSSSSTSTGSSSSSSQTGSTTSSNSTVSSSSSASRTSSASTTSRTGSTTTTASSTSPTTSSISSASNLASPLALVLLAIAAFVTLN